MVTYKPEYGKIESLYISFYSENNVLHVLCLQWVFKNDGLLFSVYLASKWGACYMAFSAIFLKVDKRAKMKSKSLRQIQSKNGEGALGMRRFEWE